MFRLVLSNAVSYFPLQRLTVYQVLMKNGLCLYQHQVQRLNVCKLVQIDNECILFGQVFVSLVNFHVLFDNKRSYSYT